MAFSIKEHHGGYNVSPRTSAVKYIVCHYVGSGTSAPGSALANCKYFAGGNRNASAHYFIDDADIYEYADPHTHYTWHCGDGGGRYGITNSNSIGIEVCINGNVPYTEPEIERLAWLVQKLMADFGIPASRVVRHYDASRKACPYYYTPYGKGGDAEWSKLHARIASGATPESEPEPKPTFTEDDMNCFIEIPKEGDVKSALTVWLCNDRIHDLSHPDDVKYVNECYKACFGKDMPVVKLSASKDKPEFQRLVQAVEGGIPSADLIPSIAMLPSRSEHRADGNDGTE